MDDYVATITKKNSQQVYLNESEWARSGGDGEGGDGGGGFDPASAPAIAVYVAAAAILLFLAALAYNSNRSRGSLAVGIANPSSDHRRSARVQ